MPRRTLLVPLLVLALLLMGCDGNDEPDDADPEQTTQGGDGGERDADGDPDAGGDDGERTASLEPEEIEARLRTDFFLPDDDVFISPASVLIPREDGYEADIMVSTRLSRSEVAQAYEDYFAAEGWTSSEEEPQDDTPEEPQDETSDETPDERASSVLRFERDGANGQLVIRDRGDGSQITLRLEQSRS